MQNHRTPEARRAIFPQLKNARIMKNAAEKINGNRLGNGRIQEEENDQIITSLVDLIITICSIGSDDIYDL